MTAKLLSTLVKLLRRPETRVLLLTALKLAEARYFDRQREAELKSSLERALGPLGAQAISAQTFFRVLRLALLIADEHLSEQGLRSALRRAGLPLRSAKTGETPVRDASSEPEPAWFKPPPGWPNSGLAHVSVIQRAREDLPGWTLRIEPPSHGYYGDVRYVVSASKHFMGPDVAPSMLTGTGQTVEEAYQGLLKSYEQLKRYGLR